MTAPAKRFRVISRPQQRQRRKPDRVDRRFIVHENRYRRLDGAALREMFGIDDTRQAVATLVMGQPDIRYRRTVRREAAKVTWL